MSILKTEKRKAALPHQREGMFELTEASDAVRSGVPVHLFQRLVPLALTFSSPRQRAAGPVVESHRSGQPEPELRRRAPVLLCQLVIQSIDLTHGGVVCLMCGLNLSRVGVAYDVFQNGICLSTQTTEASEKSQTADILDICAA